jgi:hypothetical protein
MKMTNENMCNLTFNFLDMVNSHDGDQIEGSFVEYRKGMIFKFALGCKYSSTPYTDKMTRKRYFDFICGLISKIKNAPIFEQYYNARILINGDLVSIKCLIPVNDILLTQCGKSYKIPYTVIYSIMSGTNEIKINGHTIERII